LESSVLCLFTTYNTLIMLKKRCLYLLVGSINLFIYPQIPVNLPGSVSLAGTSVSDKTCWSGFHNPAPLAYSNRAYLQARVDSRYNITELSTKSFTLSYPFEWAVTGFSLSYFGFDSYNEMICGLTFARDFSGLFSLGLQFNYLSFFNIAQDSRHGVFFPQAGLNLRFTPNLNFGFQTFNPFQSSLKSFTLTKHVPSIYSFGFANTFSEKLVLRVQTDKEIRSPYKYSMALEYNPVAGFGCQIGLYDQKMLVPCLGFRVNLNSFIFNFSAELHPLLGVSTSVAVLFTFSNKP